MRMTNEPQHAESMPVVRKVAKGVAGVSVAALWIAALWMSYAVMAGRAEGEPVFVAVGLVALAVACDLWVGAGPVVLRSAKDWGIGAWRWVGWGSLVAALAFTYFNKVSFWQAREHGRAESAIVRSVDTLAIERGVVEQNPGARLPAQVQGELSGAVAQRATLAADLDDLPVTWVSRRQRVRTELAALDQRIGDLRAELAVAEAVAQAKAVIAAGAQASALRELAPPQRREPLWVHMLIGAVHEALQLVMLIFATLRIPAHKKEEEVEYLLRERKSRMNRKVQDLRLRLEEVRTLKTEQQVFDASKHRLPKLAKMQAELKGDEAELEIEWARRQFDARKKTLLEGPLTEIPEERRLEHLPGDLKTERPAAYKRVVHDAETGEELVRVRGHYKRRRRVDNQTHAELVEEPPAPSPDDAPVLLDSDPRVARQPAQEPEPLPALLGRARQGEVLSDDELQRLLLAGLIEQSEDGNWREVEPTTRVAAEFE